MRKPRSPYLNHRHLQGAAHSTGTDRRVFLPESRERSINMKAKLYIDSEDSTIKIEGGPSDVLHLLVCAIAQILKSYFPNDFERQMG